METNYKKIKLNDKQREAVEHKTGPALIVAGAGTGKTKVIIERLVTLINSGVDKNNILCLTFTEKATQEMIDRASEQLDESYGAELAIYTFNAFGQLIIQEFAVEIGLSNAQKLVGEDGRIVFMREHLDDLQLDYFALSSKADGQLSDLADYFSTCKQQLLSPKKYHNYANKLPSGDEPEILEKKKHTELAKAYEKYISLMRENNVIDYDDQIFLAIDILEKRPNIARKLQKRYKYIMVDEFQDTNPMQSRLIDLLVGEDKNIFAVGDDDQAIYGWRGATLANILDFTKHYKGANRVALVENYRNTQSILDSSYKLIQNNNPNRLENIENLDKKLIAQQKNGNPPIAYEFETRQLEVAWVAEDIAKRTEIAKNQNRPASIAVLARSHTVVKDMHDMLNLYNIDHAVAGLGEDIYKQPIINTLLDTLSAVWSPKSNSMALYHTLSSKLFNCDPGLIAKLAYSARSKHLPLYDLLKSSEDNNILNALKLIDNWHSQVGELSVRRMAYDIITDSGLKDSLVQTANNDPLAERQILLIGQWFKTLHDFEAISTTPSVFSYLENLPALKAEGELVDDTTEITDGLPVVMTMHKSKGLEWDTVYVIGANERSFPYLGGGSSLKLPNELQITSDADSRLAEERRLMYVCTTRARQELFITHCKNINGGSSIRKPSRFIEEMGLTSTVNEANNINTDLEHHNNFQQNTPIGLPSDMTDGENIVLSASKAEDYLDCPLNFYYKHVLSVPEITGPEAEVGDLIHKIIQEINEAKQAGKTPELKTKLLERINAEWPESGYDTRKIRDNALHNALQTFDTLYDRLLTEPVPIKVEEKFRVHIPDSQMILHGRIDAVLPYGDGIEIHDYKTSNSVATAEKAKSKVGSSQQITMYAMAWRIMTGDKPDFVALDYVLTGQVGRMKKQDKSLDTMEKKLTQAASDIKAGKFPLGSSHDYCIHPTES